MWFLTHTWILPALMALSFLLILFFGKHLPRKGSEIGIAAVGICFVLALFTAGSWWNHTNDTSGAEHAAGSGAAVAPSAAAGAAPAAGPGPAAPKVEEAPPGPPPLFHTIFRPSWEKTRNRPRVFRFRTLRGRRIAYPMPRVKWSFWISGPHGVRPAEKEYRNFNLFIRNIDRKGLW